MLNKNAVEFIRHASEDQVTELVLALAVKHPTILNEMVDDMARAQQAQSIVAVFGFSLDPMGEDAPSVPDEGIKFPFQRDAVIRYMDRNIFLNPSSQRTLIDHTNKVEAIKYFRNVTGTALKEAKDCVEFLAENRFIPETLAGVGQTVYNHHHISCYESSLF